MQLPDAEELVQRLIEQIRPQMTPHTALVGIHTGGAWLAERLQHALGIETPLGTIDVSFHRDDFGERGLSSRPKRTQIPFEAEDSHIILVDDVLYTGRTVRAALNELFDYGRPARVELAVLVDRGGRELPIAARYCGHTLEVEPPASETLELGRDETGVLSLKITHA